MVLLYRLPLFINVRPMKRLDLWSTSAIVHESIKILVVFAENANEFGVLEVFRENVLRQ